MKKKVLIGLVVLVVVSVGVLLAVKVGKNNTQPGQDQANNAQPSQSSEAPVTPQSGEVAVTISDFKYSPAKLVVKKGSTVTWTNQDDVQHDIASDSDSEKRGLASPLLSKGQTFSNVFNEAGTFKYHCRPHPYMMASVQVVE